LNDHVIHTVHIELDLCPAVAMAQAKLSLLQVRWLQPKTNRTKFYKQDQKTLLLASRWLKTVKANQQVNNQFEQLQAIHCIK
jgi:hypothetical protein